MEPEPLPIKKRSKKRNLTERKTTTLSDGALAEKSRAWHVLFTQNMASFQAFDPELDAAFLTNWINLTAELEGQETDETAVDGVTITTRQVSDKTALVLERIGSVEYFAKKAFPNRGRTLLQFGFEKLSAPFNTGIPRFVFFCYAMNKVLNDFNADLLAAGMPATLPDEYMDAVEALAQAEVNQEYQKRLRLRSTEQRIDLFNALYETCLKVHKAAQVVYYGQPVMIKQFELV